MIRIACDQELPGQDHRSRLRRRKSEGLSGRSGQGGAPEIALPQRRGRSRRLEVASRQPSRGVGGRSQRATLDQDQRPIPRVLCLDGGRPGGGRDRGLPLEEDATMTKKLKPMHPGEVLREEFLVPLKMSAGALAKACGFPPPPGGRIASEQTGITADTALRLAKALGTTAQLWLNLQNDYDIQIAKRDLGKVLDRIETVKQPKAA